MNTFTNYALGCHTVDYGMILEEMIEAGNYTHKNKEITEKSFRVVGEGKVEFEDTIFFFNVEISTEDAMKEIIAADSKNPWEPSKIENILAYGAQKPEKQRRKPILGPGSIVEFGGNRFMPYLGGGRFSRSISLICRDCFWSAGTQFLAVRRVPQTLTP